MYWYIMKKRPNASAPKAICWEKDAQLAASRMEFLLRNHGTDCIVLRAGDPHTEELGCGVPKGSVVAFKLHSGTLYLLLSSDAAPDSEIMAAYVGAKQHTPA